MNPYVHTTDLFRLLSCPRLAWQSHEHTVQPMPYANCAENFQELTTQYLHMNHWPVGRVGDRVEDTARKLQEYQGGRHLRLEHQGVRAQIPVLMAIGALFESPHWFEEFQHEHAPGFGYAILDYKPDSSTAPIGWSRGSETTGTIGDELQKTPVTDAPAQVLRHDEMPGSDDQQRTVHDEGQVSEDRTQTTSGRVQQADNQTAIASTQTQAPAGGSVTSDRDQEAYDQILAPVDLPVRESQPQIPGEMPMPHDQTRTVGEQTPAATAKKSVPYWQRKYAAIYPHLSKAPGNYEIPFLKMNQSLARACGVDIVHHQTLYLDPSYIRGEELKPEQMLRISSRYFKKPGLPSTKTINQQLREDTTDFDEVAAQGKDLLFGPIPAPVKCRTCLAPRHCSSYHECFGGLDLPNEDPSFLFSSRQKKKISAAGITDMQDLDGQTTDGFALQYAQVQAARSQGRFVDKQAVRRWMDGLSWPLIYLDFEWDTFAIPPYPGMKPFDVLCFQYSMHVEEEDGTLRHYNFFEGGDCREAFIQTLLARIPRTGSVVVYNMEGAEKLRLIQLAEQFPAYSEQLESVWSRMVDLSSLFEHGAVYDLSQRGRFSLKQVLPLFDSQNSYGQLEVQDGLQAIYAYRNHESCPDPNKRKEIAESISRYCEMDTMAEVMILHGLKELEAKEI